MIVYIMQAHRDFGTESDRVEVYANKSEAISAFRSSVLATGEENGEDMKGWEDKSYGDSIDNVLFDKDEFSISWSCSDDGETAHLIELYSQFIG